MSSRLRCTSSLMRTLQIRLLNYCKPCNRVNSFFFSFCRSRHFATRVSHVSKRNIRMRIFYSLKSNFVSKWQLKDNKHSSLPDYCILFSSRLRLRRKFLLDSIATIHTYILHETQSTSRIFFGRHTVFQLSDTRLNLHLLSNNKSYIYAT